MKLTDIVNDNKFFSKKLNEQKNIVNTLLEEEIDRKIKEEKIGIYKPYTLHQKLIILNEKKDLNKYFKDLFYEFIKIMTVMENHEIKMINVKKTNENARTINTSGITFFGTCPMFVYNESGKLLEVYISKSCKGFDCFTSIFRAFNNRFLISLEEEKLLNLTK